MFELTGQTAIGTNSGAGVGEISALGLANVRANIKLDPLVVAVVRWRV